MSDPQSIDLSELQSLSFRPSWVGDTAKPKADTPAAPSADVVWNFGSGADRGDRQDRGDRRGGGGRNFDNRGGGGGGGSGGERRSGPGGPRRDGPPQGDRGPRPAGGGERPPRRDGPPQGERGPRPERRDGPGGPNNGPGPSNRGPRRDGPDRREQRDDRRGPDRRDERSFDDRPRLPQGWCARIQPEPRAVEALARQIKASGRAYSVFDVAKLFLSARDRYLVHFYHQAAKPAPTAEGAPAPAADLIQCTLDSSLWLNKEEALRHIRSGPAMTELYREETVTVDAPKGVFTAIAVCGFSGVLLGPPNHHSYPVAVAKLHREEFYNVPLDRYKSRIQVEKGEEIVAKWLEQQSTVRQFVAVKVAEGEEAPRFKTLAERDAHFLKHHAEDSLKAVREITIAGNIPGKLLSPALLSLLRVELDNQNRFPMNLVQELCRELETHNLRFFKRDRKTTFVCRSRPQFLGDEVILSERIRSIVEMVRANPGISYGKIVGLLAPAVVEPVAAAPEPAATDEASAPAGEIASAPAPVAAPAPMLSMGELAIMQDIKWLVQEGFLTEFSTGELHLLGREHKERKPTAEAPTPAVPVEAPMEAAEPAAEAPEVVPMEAAAEAVSEPVTAEAAAEATPETEGS